MAPFFMSMDGLYSNMNHGRLAPRAEQALWVWRVAYLAEITCSDSLDHQNLLELPR